MHKVKVSYLETPLNSDSTVKSKALSIPNRSCLTIKKLDRLSSIAIISSKLKSDAN